MRTNCEGHVCPRCKLSWRWIDSRMDCNQQSVECLRCNPRARPFYAKLIAGGWQYVIGDDFTTWVLNVRMGTDEK